MRKSKIIGVVAFVLAAALLAATGTSDAQLARERGMRGPAPSESKSAPKTAPKAGPKADAKAAPKSEPKAAPKSEPKAELKKDKGAAADKDGLKAAKSDKGDAKGGWMRDARAKQPPFPWIDAHIHITAPNAGGLRKMLEKAAADLNGVGVSKAMVMPTPLAPFSYQDYVKATRNLPDGLILMGGSDILDPLIHDNKPEDVTPELRKQFVALAERVLDDGAIGFGEMAALHFSLAEGHKYMNAAPDHPLFLALAEVAARRNAVIDLHLDPIVGTRPLASGLKSPPNPKSIPDNVAAFERLLAHDRGARIVWAHGGMDPFGGMTAELVGRLMDRHPNLFMSLRVAPPPLTVSALGLHIRNKLMDERGPDPAWLAVLKKHADRFVIGTDSFFLVEGGQSPVGAFVAGNEIKWLATNLFLASLPEGLGRRIASENAARIYRLNGKN